MNGAAETAAKFDMRVLATPYEVHPDREENFASATACANAGLPNWTLS